MDRCTSSVCSGDYVCCLDAGHNGMHVSCKYGNRFASSWTSWDDLDGDEEDYACSHTEIDLIEGKPPDDGTLWRCTVCGDVLKEVHDPNGTTWVDSIPHGQGRKVRYDNLTQSLASPTAGMIPCGPCAGTGEFPPTDGETCSRCGGRGEIHVPTLAWSAP